MKHLSDINIIMYHYTELMHSVTDSKITSLSINVLTMEMN